MDTQKINPFSDEGPERVAPRAVAAWHQLDESISHPGSNWRCGMGSVYRARDLHFPNVVKLVAVKEMINQAPDPLVRQTIVQNFEREANILATLSHPAIPRIYDYFTLDNRSYLALEFINGKDLEVILSQTEGIIPEEQVWAGH